jgi:membrane protease YdiL (CAAX protease family)
MLQTKTGRELTTFLGCTFGVSAVFYCLIFVSGSPSVGQRYIPGLMWTPGLSALATRLLFHRNVRNLGWRWPGTWWAALAYVLPMAYALASYGAIWLLGLGRMDVSRLSEHPLLLVFVGSLFSLVMAAGEEIGWRGFLVPALARSMSFGSTVLASGVIWVIYHAPLILFGEYRNSTTPAWYSMLCFSIMAGSLALPLAWLRLRTDSMWPAAFLHASHNLYVQAILDPITVDTGTTRWLSGEFGAGLALTTAATAWLFWRARAAVTTSSEKAAA